MIKCIKSYDLYGEELLTSGKTYLIDSFGFDHHFNHYHVSVMANNGVLFSFNVSNFDLDEQESCDVIEGLFPRQMDNFEQFIRNLEQLLEFGESQFSAVHVTHLLKPLLKHYESKRNNKFPKLFTKD